MMFNLLGPLGAQYRGGIIMGVTDMQRQLSAVPAARRRQAVRALSVLSVLFLAVGILPWTAPAPLSVRLVALVAVLAAALGASIAWGLAHSITLDRQRAREAEFDAMLAAAGGGCNCGTDHGAGGHPARPGATDAASSADPDCPADGHGATCAHDCAACVLSQLR
jgi:hypothetical protein